jgi:hypothetical protein
MVVEIPAKDDAAENQVGFPMFEDRIILVRAADEQAARAKGEEFAAVYTKTSSWTRRKIVDLQEIETELGDGTEVYSVFIGREWADLLMKGGKSPIGEWKKQNPGKDAGEATMQEIVDAWENPAKET